MNRIRLLLSALLRGARGICAIIFRHWIFVLVGLIVLVAGVIGFVRFRDSEPEVELANMDSITYKLRGFSLKTDELTATLTEAHSLLRQKVGLPAFEGDVVIVFDPTIEGGGEMRRLSSSRRELRLSSAMNGLGIQKRELVHELVHASWQSDIIHERYPILAIEGIAQSLAEILVAPKSSWLIEELNDFYFQDLVGLLSPDTDLEKLEEWRRLLSYELAAKLFITLDKIDPTLLPKLLQDTPEQKLDWLAFCKRIVSKSDAPDEVRKLFNKCQVFFGPLPEEYYIIPIRKPNGESVTVGIFLPEMKTRGPVRIEYRLEDDENRTRSDERLLFFKNGYGKFDVQLPNSAITLDINLIAEGRTFFQRFKFGIPITGGERR